MYNRIAIENRRKNTINLGIIIFIFLIGILFVRVINVLRNSNERGSFAYVQLLNFGMPVLEAETYNEEDFAENKLSIKRVMLEALGISNISPLKIIGGELSVYKSGLSEEVTSNNSSFNPFIINESTIKSKKGTEVAENIQQVNGVVNEALKKPLNTAVPEVLIYHTHTSEAFGGVTPDSSDTNTNIVGVGEALRKELEENYGISVLHDTTNHSQSYNGCYNRSRETVTRYLEKYGDFKLIIDLHRDSVDNKNAVTANYNGENLAKIMFVNTRNSSRYNKNCEITRQLYNKANELFPGITRDIYTYNSGMVAFNQDLSDNSILIECGSNTNTMEEAVNSTKYIARIIAEVLSTR